MAALALVHSVTMPTHELLKRLKGIACAVLRADPAIVAAALRDGTCIATADHIADVKARAARQRLDYGRWLSVIQEDPDTGRRARVHVLAVNAAITASENAVAKTPHRQIRKDRAHAHRASHPRHPAA